MCNANNHPPACACGFGPPRPYNYPIAIDHSPNLGSSSGDEILSAIDLDNILSLGRFPGIDILSGEVIADLKLCLPETLFDNTGGPPWIPIYDVSEASLDPNRPLEEQYGFSFEPWKPEDLQAFDKEIADMNDTISALQQRIEDRDQAGRPLDESDMRWLNSKQTAGPTGFRSKRYRESPQVIRDAIDDYEAWCNPSHWRDITRLIIELLKFRGVPHMNRVMYEIEIGRVTEYRDLLLGRRNRPVRKHYRRPDRHGE